MTDLPPPLPGEIDREGEPPRDPIGDIQEWVRSYQEAPPHPPDESTMHVGSRTVPETWYLAAVAERDAALAEAAAWKQRFESAWGDMNRAVAAGPAAEADRLRALEVRLRDALALVAGHDDRIPFASLLADPEVQAL